MITLKTGAYQITGSSITEVCATWAKTRGMFDNYADTVIVGIEAQPVPTTLAEDVDRVVGRLLAEGLPVDRVPKSVRVAEVESTLSTLVRQLCGLSFGEAAYLQRQSAVYANLAKHFQHQGTNHASTVPHGK